METLFLLVIFLVLPDASVGEPRAQTIQLVCSHQPVQNTTIYSTNSIATMKIISTEIRTSGFGVAISGRRPDASYALAQCYGDLSLSDCATCYAEAQTVLISQCYPYNRGQVFLDGCFVRTENYSFFQEFSGPQDRIICGNETVKDSVFWELVKSAVLEAVIGAPNKNGTAHVQLISSAHVSADCWKSLSPGSCRACLEKASQSIMGCLPWSEGRALNAGCFMRYSATNFLNGVPTRALRGTYDVTPPIRPGNRWKPNGPVPY